MHHVMAWERVTVQPAMEAVCLVTCIPVYVLNAAFAAETAVIPVRIVREPGRKNACVAGKPTVTTVRGRDIRTAPLVPVRVKSCVRPVADRVADQTIIQRHRQIRHPAVHHLTARRLMVLQLRLLMKESIPAPTVRGKAG